MNSFAGNSYISRNDKEHSYGTKVAFPVPSVIGRQDYDDVSSWRCIVRGMILLFVLVVVVFAA
jgi:hypothetical protein